MLILSFESSSIGFIMSTLISQIKGKFESGVHKLTIKLILLKPMCSIKQEKEPCQSTMWSHVSGDPLYTVIWVWQASFFPSLFICERQLSFPYLMGVIFVERVTAEDQLLFYNPHGLKTLQKSISQSIVMGPETTKPSSGHSAQSFTVLHQ